MSIALWFMFITHAAFRNSVASTGFQHRVPDDKIDLSLISVIHSSTVPHVKNSPLRAQNDDCKEAAHVNWVPHFPTPRRSLKWLSAQLPPQWSKSLPVVPRTSLIVKDIWRMGNIAFEPTLMYGYKIIWLDNGYTKRRWRCVSFKLLHVNWAINY